MIRRKASAYLRMVQSHRRCAGEAECEGSLSTTLHRLPGKGRLRAVAAVGQGCGEQMSRSTPFQRGVELDWAMSRSVDL